MKYFEITGAPVYRETNPVLSPITALASRLEDENQYVELTFSSYNSLPRCFAGVPDHIFRAAKNVLQNSGYSYVCSEDIHGIAPREIKGVFVRKAERQFYSSNGTAAQSIMFPTVDENGSERLEDIFSALRTVNSECGISLWIFKAQGMSCGTFTQLSELKKACYSENALDGLLDGKGRKFRAVMGIYGKDENDVRFLKTELSYAFPQLVCKEIKASSVDQLFEGYSSSWTNGFKIIETLYTAEELDVLAKLPDSRIKQGIAINKDTLFGIITPASNIPEAPEDSLYMGYLQNGKSVFLPLKTLRKHMFIAGEPGSGKGNQTFSFAYQLHGQDIPFLLIESAKKEQHHLGKVIPDLKVWRPTEGEFEYNPFHLPEGVRLKDYRASLIKMLNVCFKLDGPLEELFTESLNRCYSKYGYDDNSLSTDANVKSFGMNEFMEDYTALVDESEYSPKTKADMKTAGLVRLNSLFNANRGVYDAVNSIDVSELIKGENLIQLDCLTTPESKQLFATMLLLSLGAKLRLCHKTLVDRPLRLVIILDEAHNLLNTAQTADGREFPFTEQFYNLLLEMRSLGVGIIIADQSTKNIDSKLSEVCGTKMFFGCSPVFNGMVENALYFKADEAALDNMYLIEPGEGCFLTLGMEKGILLKTENLIDKFGLDDDFQIENKYLKKNERAIIESFRECSNCPTKGKCTFGDKVASRRTSSSLITKHKSKISKYLNSENTDKDALLKALMSVAKDIYSECKNEEQKYCSSVQFTRDFNRTHSKKLNLQEVLKINRIVWNETFNKKQGGNNEN